MSHANSAKKGHKLSDTMSFKMGMFEVSTYSVYLEFRVNVHDEVPKGQIFGWDGWMDGRIR